MKQSTQFLIIGATGKTGSRVVKGLESLGFKPKRAGRNAEVLFDWDDATTWSPTLVGVDRIYLTYYPDLAVPKAPDDISRFCALAKMKGIQHITLLSGRGEPAAQACEDIVKQSGVNWTVVRASWFNQNFSEGFFRQYILNGKISLPVSSMTEPFIDVDDIADVVLASLTDAKHQSQLYEVTGPELISFPDIAEKFSQALSRPIVFESLTMQDFQERLAAQAVPNDVIGSLIYLFSEVLDGRNNYTTEAVEKALGRKPKTFEQFIKSNLQFFTEEVQS